MQKFRVVAGIGLVATTLLTGAHAASASTAPHPDGHRVRADRVADTMLPKGAESLGATGAGSPVSFEVVLASSNPAGEQSLVQDEYDRSSPLYHHWLTPSTFDAEFGPAAATVSETESWLSGQGLAYTRSSEFAFSVSAPSSAVAQALGISFENYRLGSQSGYAPNAAPLVPQDVLDHLDGIIGLNTVKVPERHSSSPAATAPAATAPAATAPASAVPASAVAAGSARPAVSATGCPAANAAASSQGAETMLTESSTYGVEQLWNDGLVGSGQSIAVYELAGYQSSDVNADFSCFGLTNKVTAVGSASVDLSGGGTAEADLDIEQAAQQAPGATIYVYQADQYGNNAYNLWSDIVAADSSYAVSTSWGECEPDDNQGGDNFESTVNSLMEQATLQGQTVFAASGDSGSEDCAADYFPPYEPDPGYQPPSYWNTASVDFPGASPWVTSVGGTQFAPGGYPTSAEVDTVSSSNLYAWNWCLNQTNTDANSNCMNGRYSSGFGAGGGGVSDYEPAPWWQEDYFSARNESAPGGCNGPCREVPDVSGQAGYPILSYGPDTRNAGDASDWNAGIGTSYAAPYMAGLIADRNSGCYTTTGNFGPYAYALAVGSATYPAAFTDIGSGHGNNDMIDHYGGSDYPTAAGYDMATGLGTPVPVGIACPLVTSIAGGVTTAAAGSTITLNGIGLEEASIYFGRALATLAPNTTPTATSISVVVPQVNPSSPATPTQVYISGTVDGESGRQTVSVPITVTGTGPTNCAAASGFTLPDTVAIAAVTINGCPGYFVTDAKGRVAAFGSATTHGDMAGIPDGSPIVGITATPDGEGYYLFDGTGGTFTFGDAVFRGAAFSYGPSTPIVGLSVIPNGSGYWELEANGGVFTFGPQSYFHGSLGTYNIHSAAPMVGMSVAPNGSGYWIVSQAGGIFAFNAAFEGAEGAKTPTAPVVGINGTSDGQGYTVMDLNGKVYLFGDANAYPYELADPPGPLVRNFSATVADDGFYAINAYGEVYAYGNTKYFGGVS